MPDVPSKVTFTMDKKYNEKKIEKDGQPKSKYVRYRSKELPDYVFVYRPEKKSWSIRKDMSAKKPNISPSPSSNSKNSKNNALPFIR